MICLAGYAKGVLFLVMPKKSVAEKYSPIKNAHSFYKEYVYSPYLKAKERH